MPSFPSLEKLLDLAGRGAEWRRERDELLALAASGRPSEAHRRALALALASDGGLPAMAFDLEEASGRRGARRLLGRARQGDGSPLSALPPPAWEPLVAWAHFRLWRHGRALALAEEARERLGTGEPGGDPAEGELVAGLWLEALDAIAGLALRQGYLGQAERALALGARFGELVSPGPDRAGPGRMMAALEVLLGQHQALGVPSSLLRYLGRSLGHPGGDSQAAARELARDLSLTPSHLAIGRELATRLGLSEAVSERLLWIEERVFRGRWRARRLLLGLAILVFLALVIGIFVLGLTLLQHRFF
ncbi:MAG: hypothetical protein RBU30_16485 [Polyangia bacterium]|jgi:hypothetical protein|nr:hypothetical protein [Polyangia bacterium]